MRRILIFVLVFVLSSGVFVYPDNDDTDWIALSYFFGRYLSVSLPAGEFAPSLIENYFPETTSIIEESNGFSVIDNSKIYFEGDSFTQFNWYLNGLNINSSLNEGSAGVILPFSSVSLDILQGQVPSDRINGLNRLSGYDRVGNNLNISTIYSDMGTFSSWSQFLINTPASERGLLLREERRKPLSNYYVDYGFVKNNEKNKLKFSISYFDMERQFNDFNTVDKVFKENGRLLSALFQYRRGVKNNNLELFGVLNNIDRSNENAELGSLPQETIDLKRLAFLAGLSIKKQYFNLSVWMMYENEERKPFVKNYKKDLIDNDGVGFIMPSRFGIFRATSLFGKLDIPLKNTKTARFNLFSDFKYSKNEAWEETDDYNLFTVNNNPYLVRTWDNGSPYSNYNLDMKIGVTGNLSLSSSIGLFGKFYIQKNTLKFGNSLNNLDFLTPSFDLGIKLSLSKKTVLFVAYGVSAYDLRNNVGSFLESNRPSSVFNFWKDTNDNNLFEDSERGEIYGYSGGKVHFLDENIQAPKNERLFIALNKKIYRNYRLLIKGIYKRIKNSLWVYFDKEYGFYEKGRDEPRLYFFDEPFKNYYLSNSKFKDDPFYLQFLINFIGTRREKWFFSFSFMAHMGMGNTSFGNGYNNDIGIIDESMANPNTWLNSFGRLDGERGFVSKLNYVLFLTKKLSLGINIKYRDGNPFAFMRMSDKYDQWVFYYKTIKGEDERGKKGGPREDYLADINLKINYAFSFNNLQFELGISAFNILDVGYELSEMVFKEEKDRYAAELQIPRSIRLNLRVKF